MASAMGQGLQHRTVLLDEAVNALITRADGVYVDGTFGRGGHSRAILGRLGDAGRLIAFDKDPLAIATAQTIGDARFSIVHESFASLRDELASRGVGVCREYCWTLACRRRKSTTRSAVSVSAQMARSTCGWTRR